MIFPWTRTNALHADNPFTLDRCSFGFVYLNRCSFCKQNPNNLFIWRPFQCYHIQLYFSFNLLGSDSSNETHLFVVVFVIVANIFAHFPNEFMTEWMHVLCVWICASHQNFTSLSLFDEIYLSLDSISIQNTITLTTFAIWFGKISLELNLLECQLKHV